MMLLSYPPSNLTEILLEKNATRMIVEDFNLVNIDLNNLDSRELEAIDKNIPEILASLDDLKKSIKEELLKRAEIKASNKDSEVKEKINTILQGYTIDNKVDKSKKDTIASNNVKSSDSIPAKDESKLEATTDMRAFEDSSVKIDSDVKTQEREDVQNTDKESVEVSPLIRLAVELFKKYRIGIPYLEEGNIIKDIENRVVTNEDSIQEVIYMLELLQQNFNVSDDDVKRIFKAMDDEFRHKRINSMGHKSKHKRNHSMEHDIMQILNALAQIAIEERNKARNEARSEATVSRDDNTSGLRPRCYTPRGRRGIRIFLN